MSLSILNFGTRQTPIVEVTDDETNADNSQGITLLDEKAIEAIKYKRSQIATKRSFNSRRNDLFQFFEPTGFQLQFH